MKYFLIAIILFLGFQVNAQNFKIDISKDSIISMRKFMRPDSSWRIEIKRYVGISDSIKNTSRIDYYIIQENTRAQIDSVVWNLSRQIIDAKRDLARIRDKAQYRRLQQKGKRDRLQKSRQRLIRNESKLNALKL
ncbi:MAG: hypothetical protein GXO85_02215 [Chlorobi bacterium]|nr:hypothetical protein [Chlorobiota bacterium]